MNRDLRKVRGLKKNPFHEELMKEFKVAVKREYISGDKGAQHTIINNDTSEVIGESRFFKVRKYDKEQYAKVFVAKMEMMWDMIPPATRMYTYILTNLPIGKSEMYFDFDDIKTWTRYKSPSSLWKGINWLIDNDFIAKSYKPNHFWLNPTMFFNGDRAAFVEVLVKEEKEIISKKELPLSEGL